MLIKRVANIRKCNTKNLIKNSEKELELYEKKINVFLSLAVFL